MTIEEKIAALDKNVAKKSEKLNTITAVIESKRTAAKKLAAEIDRLEKNKCDLQAELLFAKLKGKGIGIGSVIKAIDTGAICSTGDDSAKSSTNMEQEEKPNEISDSGKAISGS